MRRCCTSRCLSFGAAGFAIYFAACHTPRSRAGAFEKAFGRSVRCRPGGRRLLGRTGLGSVDASSFHRAVPGPVAYHMELPAWLSVGRLARLAVIAVLFSQRRLWCRGHRRAGAEWLSDCRRHRGPPSFAGSLNPALVASHDCSSTLPWRASPASASPTPSALLASVCGLLRR